MKKNYIPLIKHFNSIIVEDEKKSTWSSLKLLTETIKRGFIYDSVIVANFEEDELIELAKEIDLSGFEINKTFYKSWDSIRDKSRFELYVDQVAHYMTTYGFQLLGIFDEDHIYIPNDIEEVDVPNVDTDKIKLKVIKGISKDEAKEKLYNLLESGIALSEDTKQDIVGMIGLIGDFDIGEINNKEIRMVLYDLNNIIPRIPVEFVRYCIYKSINETLLIKNNYTISSIKDKDNIDVLGLFMKYRKEYGLKPLSRIFNRFKPIFLAFKTNDELSTIINKISKLSKKYHRPMKESVMNNITGHISNGTLNEKIYQQLEDELENVNMFRIIRLANALLYRTKDVGSIVYRIRNGKTYVKEFENFEFSQKVECYDIVRKYLLPLIRNKIETNLDDKKVYIPDNIDYPLPTTERQFVGNFPFGTSIKVDDNLIFGVHWNNFKDYGIDLDLSMILNGVKYGWNGRYKNDDNIMYSGDITNAPNGASEFIYIKDIPEDNIGVLYFNYYNYIKDLKVPYDIIVAQDTPNTFDKKYMVDPNDVTMKIKSNIDEKNNVIGIIKFNENGNKFYFTNDTVGGTNVSKSTERGNQVRDYLANSYESMLTVNDILNMINNNATDCILVDDPEDADINLSPENVEKDTFINLVK